MKREAIRFFALPSSVDAHALVDADHRDRAVLLAACVGQGVIFPSGRVVVEWREELIGTTLDPECESMARLLRLHRHRLMFVPIDPLTFLRDSRELPLSRVRLRHCEDRHWAAETYSERSERWTRLGSAPIDHATLVATWAAALEEYPWLPAEQ